MFLLAVKFLILLSPCLNDILTHQHSHPAAAVEPQRGVSAESWWDE